VTAHASGYQVVQGKSTGARMASLACLCVCTHTRKGTILWLCIYFGPQTWVRHSAFEIPEVWQSVCVLEFCQDCLGGPPAHEKPPLLFGGTPLWHAGAEAIGWGPVPDSDAFCRYLIEKANVSVRAGRRILRFGPIWGGAAQTLLPTLPGLVPAVGLHQFLFFC